MFKVNPFFTKNTQNIPNLSPRKRQIEYNPNEERLNWEWYQPTEDSLPVSFCMQTSLHGLKHLGEGKRHIVERIFWVTAFIASLITSVFLIWGMWRYYSEMPIVTVFTPTKIKLDEIPFPGVTLCNVNGLKKSMFYKIMNELIEVESQQGKNISKEENSKMSKLYLQKLGKMLDMDQICSSTYSFTDMLLKNTYVLALFAPFRKIIKEKEVELEKYHHNPFKTLKLVSQPCSEMILHCVWQQQVVGCDELFRSVETDYGHCCTFNSVPASLLLPNPDETTLNRSNVQIEKWRNASLNSENVLFTKDRKNRSVPYRQKYPGRTAGLSFFLYPAIDEYFCTNTDSEGFIMKVNDPLDFPRMNDDGIAIQTNSVVFVGLSPEITKSHESISGYPVDKRQCYYGNEYKLTYHSTYTVSNCMGECIARKTEKTCDCHLYYMLQGIPDEKECKPSMYNCTNNVKKDIVENGLSESCSECLSTCTEIVYHKEMTFLKLQKKKLKQLFSVFSSESHSDIYMERNVSIVHVYFSEDSVHPKLRKEVNSITGLLSNTGGLLGLCMGFSVLSLLEILYYGSLRVICRFYREKMLQDINLDTVLSSAVSSQPPDYVASQAAFDP